MNDTHPERVLKEYGEWLEVARAKAKANGWQAYMEILQAQGGVPPGKGTFYLGKALIHANMERIFHKMQDPYNYSKFSHEPGISGFFGWMEKQLIASGQDPNELRTNLSANMAMVWHVICHAENGSQTYEVTPGLADRLAHTTLRGLATEDLRLPYRALYIHVPSSAGLRVWNYDTQWHAVDGLYLVESSDARGRAWRFLVVGKSKNPEDYFDDALFYFCVSLPPGIDVETALDQEEQRVMSIYTHNPLISEFKDEWRHLFNWVMNAMVYATCSNVRQETVINNKEARQLTERIAKLSPGKKRDELRTRLKALSPNRRTILGPGIKPFSDAEKAPYKQGEHLLRVRTLVEGFYRNQPYGPQHSLRRVQWIEPFWRPRLGEEDLPTSTPTHVLK